MRHLAILATLFVILGCGCPLEPLSDAGPEDAPECVAVDYSPWERPDPFFCAQSVEHYKHCGLYGGSWARCADGCHLCIVPGADAAAGL
jgi:hypothetical protein